jgi:uncharacterized protein (UPF0147 family)
MTIPDFKPEEFAQNLARQASELVPKDLNDYQKKYVINKLFQFCILAGNAINQDTNLKFKPEEARAIVQSIGEWTFHKNVDLIRANVPEDCWDPVLQQVAFAVFETAKQVETKKIEHNQAIKIIEEVVKDSYCKSLQELAKNNKLNEADLPKILSFSNIDTMAEETQPQMTKEQEEKLLKCASLALVLKPMPKDKINKILSRFDQTTAQQIAYLINTPDLEKKIDLNVAHNFLSTFKQTFSAPNESKQSSLTKNKISSLVDLYDENIIIKHMNFERPIIQKFIKNCLSKESDKNKNKILSPYIIDVLYDHLVEKLTV